MVKLLLIGVMGIFAFNSGYCSISLSKYVDFYNQEKPHTYLGYMTQTSMKPSTKNLYIIGSNREDLNKTFQKLKQNDIWCPKHKCRKSIVNIKEKQPQFGHWWFKLWLLLKFFTNTKTPCFLSRSLVYYTTASQSRRNNFFSQSFIGWLFYFNQKVISSFLFSLVWLTKIPNYYPPIS